MPTWSGWQNEFLNKAGLLVTPPNDTFMTQWASHSGGSCANNPNDLSQAVTGSSRCGDTVGPFGRSQKYGTHTEAARAFQIQMAASWVSPLQDALNSGNPFQIGDRSKVVAVLNRWGSTTFASWYSTATDSGTTPTNSGGSGIAPQTLRGYDAIRKSVNTTMPNAIRAAGRLRRQALRDVVAARKVHR